MQNVKSGAGFSTAKIESCVGLVGCEVIGSGETLSIFCIALGGLECLRVTIVMRVGSSLMSVMTEIVSSSLWTS